MKLGTAKAMASSAVSEATGLKRPKKVAEPAVEKRTGVGPSKYVKF
jgi:hypothetical protein